MKKLLTLAFVAVFAALPVVSVSAQSYDGVDVEPESDNITYNVAASTGDTVTLTDVGDDSSELELEFSGDSSGSIVIEQLETRPSDAPSDPEGTIGFYFNVTLNGITNDDIDNAVWRFSVEKSFINGLDGVTADNIFLNHYNGSSWERLNTRQVSETDTTYVFEADVDSFSPFAVTAVAGLTNTGSPFVLGAVLAVSMLAVAGAGFKLSRQ